MMRTYPETMRPEVFGKRKPVAMGKPYAGFPRTRLAMQSARRTLRLIGEVEVPPKMMAFSAFVAAGVLIITAMH